MRCVDLLGNNIGSAGARAIAKALGINNTITSVDLGENNIGSAGAVAIAKALEFNNTITSVDLGSNEIGDEGAVAIAKALEFNNTITSVDLGGNSIGDEGAVAIAEALKVNKTITSVILSDYEGYEGARAIRDLIERNNEFLKESVEKLKRGEVLDQDAYQTLAAHINKSKKPNEANEYGYSHNDFNQYIRKMHEEAAKHIDYKKSASATSQVLADPFMTSNIREFLDVKDIASLQQAMRGNLPSLSRGLSDVVKTLRYSPSLKAQISELDPKTRSNLLKNANKTFLNKMAEEGKAWSIAKIIKHLPEESRSDLAGVVRKLYENQSFKENPKKRKLIADAIKNPDNQNKRGWFGGLF